MKEERKSFISSLVSLFYWKENYSPFFIIMLVLLTPLIAGMMIGACGIASLTVKIYAYILESCLFGFGTGGIISFLIRKKYYSNKKRLFILTVLYSFLIYYIYTDIIYIYWGSIHVILRNLFPGIFSPHSVVSWHISNLLFMFCYHIITPMILAGSLYVITKSNYKKVFIFLTVLALIFRSFFLVLSCISEVSSWNYISIIYISYPFVIGTAWVIYTLIKERYKDIKPIILFTLLYTLLSCLFFLSSVYIWYFLCIKLLYVAPLVKSELFSFICDYYGCHFGGFFTYDNCYRNAILIIRFFIVSLSAWFSIMAGCPWLRPAKVTGLSD